MLGLKLNHVSERCPISERCPRILSYGIWWIWIKMIICYNHLPIIAACIFIVVINHQPTWHVFSVRLIVWVFYSQLKYPPTYYAVQMNTDKFCSIVMCFSSLVITRLVFFKIRHKIYPISFPWGWDMECIFWVQSLVIFHISHCHVLIRWGLEKHILGLGDGLSPGVWCQAITNASLLSFRTLRTSSVNNLSKYWNFP